MSKHKLLAQQIHSNKAVPMNSDQQDDFSLPFSNLLVACHYVVQDKRNKIRNAKAFLPCSTE